MSPTWRSFRSAIKNGRKTLLPSGDTVSKIPILDMLAHNWNLGFTSFGGPTVHFQIFHRVFVDKYKWLEETTYQELFALCQALSGPGSTKMLYSINLLHYGFWSAVLSFLLWSLPMAAAAFGLAVGIENIDQSLPGPAYALLSGLNSATVGIIALAAVQLSKKAITDTLTRLLVFFGGTAGTLYNALWYFPVLMVVGAMTTIIWDLRVLQRAWKKISKGDNRQDQPHVDAEEMESQQVDRTSNDQSQTTQRKPVQSQVDPASQQTPEPAATQSESKLTKSWKLGAVIIAAFLASFIITMVCRGLYSGSNRGFDLFANLYLAGTIIFGGGPVVIPLLREYTVTPGWLSPRDFLLGLAITQCFPGPNFNFAVYLGALAVRDSSLPMISGAIIGFLAIFTPGLWIQTGCMPVWAGVRKVLAVRACLRGTHATAVGLVFTAVYRLFEIGYLDENVRSGGSLSRDPWWVVIVATSFVGGMHFKMSPPIAIVTGAVMGLIWYGVVHA